MLTRATRAARWRLARLMWMEPLEPRVLLSSSLMASPGYVLANTGQAGPSASASVVGLTAAQIRSAYGINNVNVNGIVGTGAGQTIAIVDAYDDPNITSDLSTFDAAMGLSNPNLTVIKQSGTPASGSTGWSLEEALDVEWAHAVAPSANILLVEAASASYANLFAAVDTARNYTSVSVVSMSWSGGEAAGVASAYDSHLVTPAGHIGVTFLAASGDDGAYTNGGTSPVVGYPAVSANVVGVGGTFLSTDSAGDYLGETGWGNGTSSATSGGSGGGISQFTSQPSFQKGVVTQSSTFRTVPDVAFDADPNSGVAVYDSYDYGSSGWIQVGGTSLATPMWGGLMAITNQELRAAGKVELTGAQTLSDLYALPGSDFHDITSGNNGFAAGPGYDLVTGRGTPVVPNLVADLVGGTVVAPNPTPSVTSFSINPSSVVSGSTTTLSATATETGGSITGLSFYQDKNSDGIFESGTDTLVGAGSLSGSTWSLVAGTTGVSAGSYTLFAVATDALNQTASASGVLKVTAGTTAPANNNFANAQLMTGTSLVAVGSNVNATRETSEPKIAGNSGGKSVWYTWTAPAAGKVTLTTAGSSFDTLLGVYTGTSVSKLTLVASNDDASRSVLTSSLSFTAKKGTTYKFAVDGYNGASGNIQLNLSAPAAAVRKAAELFVQITTPTAHAFNATLTVQDVTIAEVTPVAPPAPAAPTEHGSSDFSDQTITFDSLQDWLSDAQPGTLPGADTPLDGTVLPLTAMAMA